MFVDTQSEVVDSLAIYRSKFAGPLNARYNESRRRRQDQPSLRTVATSALAPCQPFRAPDRPEPAFCKCFFEGAGKQTTEIRATHRENSAAGLGDEADGSSPWRPRQEPATLGMTFEAWPAPQCP